MPILSLLHGSIALLHFVSTGEREREMPTDQHTHMHMPENCTVDLRFDYVILIMRHKSKYSKKKTSNHMITVVLA